MPEAGGGRQLSGRQVSLSKTCMLLAVFLSALNQTVVATMLPSIVADFGGFDRYVWVVTSYLIASTVAFPIAGRLSDIYGRKPLFIFGIIVFSVGSVLAGLSQSMAQITAFRAIQGLGGGVMMTCSYTAIADLFPPQERGKQQGQIAAVYALSSVVGPALGGVFADSASWKWLFLSFGPMGILLLALTSKSFPHIGADAGKTQPDYPGMASLALAVVPLLLALSSGGVLYEWDAPQVIGMLVFGLMMSIVFVVVEAASKAPILPLEIYANRVVAAAVAAMFLASFGLYGNIIFLPLFFHEVTGASATVSGSLLVPLLLGIVGGAILSGQALSRTGNRYRAGTLLCTGVATLGMYLISGMSENTGLVLGGACIALLGLGLGGAFAVLSVAVQNSAPFALVGSATSALQFSRSVGGMLGLALLGIVMTRSFSSGLEAALSADLMAALPQGGLDALRDNPQAFLEPSAALALASSFAGTGADAVHAADALLSAVKVALAGALNDAFTVITVVMALGFGVALFLRAPDEVAD
ncbi:MAG: MFS transporter [Gammaproteobacteria bacterium]|nr:MFS transporter [Gammaproteobacteria bacterium]